jgi:hypothetical protein
LIHQGVSPRGGLTAARLAATISDIPKIVATLGRQPIYRNLFALSGFPTRPETLQNMPRLVPIDEEGEFLWTASVLRLFAAKLNNFLEEKKLFLEHYINGDYVSAELLLDSIEKNYGFSLWYIQYRLQLLQLHKGLEAQKDYVEKLLSTDGIGSLVAWLSYFFSLRSEENVSFTKLHDELGTKPYCPI